MRGFQFLCKASHVASLLASGCALVARAQGVASHGRMEGRTGVPRFTYVFTFPHLSIHGRNTVSRSKAFLTSEHSTFGQRQHNRSLQPPTGHGGMPQTERVGADTHMFNLLHDAKQHISFFVATSGRQRPAHMIWTLTVRTGSSVPPCKPRTLDKR